MAKQKAGFIHLPAELRIPIYDSYMQNQDRIQIRIYDSGSRIRRPALCWTNRQIRRETRQIWEDRMRSISLVRLYTTNYLPAPLPVALRTRVPIAGPATQREYVVHVHVDHEWTRISPSDAEWLWHRFVYQTHPTYGVEMSWTPAAFPVDDLQAFLMRLAVIRVNKVSGDFVLNRDWRPFLDALDRAVVRYGDRATEEVSAGEKSPSELTGSPISCCDEAESGGGGDKVGTVRTGTVPP